MTGLELNQDTLFVFFLLTVGFGRAVTGFMAERGSLKAYAHLIMADINLLSAIILSHLIT